MVRSKGVHQGTACTTTPRVRSYLCSPPATATGRWFSNKVTEAFFCHPQSKAVLCSAQEKGVHAAPPPLPLRDGLMQSRDVPGGLLIPFAFPPPRRQGHRIRLGRHTKSTGNETLRTPRKLERVPSQRCAARMLLSELQPRPSRWSTNTLARSKDY